MVDALAAQLAGAASRGGLASLFREIIFGQASLAGFEGCTEGDKIVIGFGNAEGPIGVLFVDLYDSGDLDDAGLTVGLRGWRLNEDIASV